MWNIRLLAYMDHLREARFPSYYKASRLLGSSHGDHLKKFRFPSNYKVSCLLGSSHGDHLKEVSRLLGLSHGDHLTIFQGINYPDTRFYDD